MRNNGKYDGYNQSKNEVYACLESNELHKPRRSRVVPIIRDWISSNDADVGLKY